MYRDENILASGSITDEALERYKSRVGSDFKVNSTFNEEATLTAVRRFCDGIGEENRLYRDPEYAAGTPWGEVTAPPSFVMSVYPGWILQGLPGVHVFHSSSDFEFYRPIRLDDHITPENTFKGYRQMKSKLGERTILEIQEARYRAPGGELYARAKLTGVRTERADAREAGVYDDITLPHPWKEEELCILEDNILNERPRGNRPLFFEDVSVGDTLPAVTKGPLGVTDIIAYCIGACPVKLQAHGLALKQYRRHPAWGFRDRHTQALEPVFCVHYNTDAAVSAGVPYPYDLGSQRHAWLMQMLTNWMGDCGWIKRCSARYSGFMFLSDAVVLNGRVTRKFVTDQGEHCIQIFAEAINQRQEAIMSGPSVVVLPSRQEGPDAVVTTLLRLADSKQGKEGRR